MTSPQSKEPAKNTTFDCLRRLHKECNYPGCACSCHARPPQLEEESKGLGIRTLLNDVLRHHEHQEDADDLDVVLFLNLVSNKERESRTAALIDAYISLKNGHDREHLTAGNAEIILNAIDDRLKELAPGGAPPSLGVNHKRGEE